MTDFTKLTPEQLDKMDKQVLITIIGSLQSQLDSISTQLNFLTEQIALMNQRTFGRKTEKADQVPHQMTLDELYHDNIFNEPEVLSDASPEPEISEVIISSYTRKKNSKGFLHVSLNIPLTRINLPKYSRTATKSFQKRSTSAYISSRRLSSLMNITYTSTLPKRMTIR